MKRNSRGWKATKVLFFILLALSIITVHRYEILIFKYKNELKDYPEIKDLAFDITKNCDNRLCYYESVKDYVIGLKSRHDGFLSDFETNDPLFTLKYGNDCEGKAILAIDLLKALGEKNIYLLIQEGKKPDGSRLMHACWMAKPFEEHNAYMLFNCIHNADIIKMTRMV